MHSAAACLLVALTGCCFATASDVFDVTKFGAKGDGKTDDSAAVRAAASALAKHGRGTLLFPGPGEFVTGPFNLSSNSYLHVDTGATVLGSLESDDWPLVTAADVWPQFGHGSDCEPGTESCRLMHQAFVFAWSASNITVGGGGTIDARGGDAGWWDCAHDLAKSPCKGYGRPHLMMISNVTDVEVRDLHIKNSPDWTLHFSSVTRLWVHHVNVTNPHNAPNSDGIDVDSTQNAVIEDCYFDVGDDALCVKSGIDWFGRLYNRPSRDVVFRRIVVGHGHGLSIGSEMSGSIYNITFEDIVMKDTEIGPRLKSQRGRGGVVDGIVFRNITASNLNQMIQLTLYYHKGLDPTNATATPRFQNILLEDLKFSGSDRGGDIDGLPESHIQNVTLRNVDFNGGKVKFDTCENIDHCFCEGTTNPCPSCCTRR
eukprot:m.313611 g.313611  ORF g.313611 m.313611 type:complete len:427 (-) comp19664_c0_seq11:3147-4427(-)